MEPPQMPARSALLASYCGGDNGFTLENAALRAICSLRPSVRHVIGVVGPAKSGKSHLLNCLLESDAFPLSASTESGTLGVLWAQSCNSGLTNIWLDSEGLDRLRASPRRSLQLRALMLQICTVLILNLNGIADRFSLEALAEAAAPLRSLPHLVIVLRDFHLELLTNEEDYLTGLLTPSAGVSRSDHDSLFYSTMKRFPSLSLHCLGNPWSKQSTEFPLHVLRLRNKILQASPLGSERPYTWDTVAVTNV